MQQSHEREDYLSHYFQLPAYKLGFAFSVGGFLSFFLIVFQPFGVTNFDPKFTISLTFVLEMGLFGVMTAGALVVTEFVLRPLLLRRLTRRRMLLWLAFDGMLVASLIFLLYNYLGDWHDFKWVSYFGFIRDVTLVISFPVLAYLFFLHHLSLRSEFVQLKNVQLQASAPGLMHFSSDNDKDHLAIAASDLLYLESQDNYVAVVYRDGATLRSPLIRSSLKRQESLHPGPTLMRCHRSFMVNLEQVRSCHGNQHGLSLSLEGVDRQIPVSRAYTSAVLDALRA